ncbi:hypothetical protein [Natronomonas moolapensis]|nr:hypothetical protein [Natronomonas moolapensis]
MVKDDQILIRLESSQKEKWQEHAEDEDRYRDTTDLVEQAVEDRISTDTEEYSPEDAILQMSQDIQNLSSDIAEIKELNEKIDNTQATSLELEETADRLETFIKTRFGGDDD